MAHERRRRATGLAGALALVVIAAVAEWVRYAPSEPVRWAPDLVVGLAWVGCGVFVTLRTPATGSGLLMLALGGAWFLGNFAGVGAAAVAGVAAQSTYLHRGVLAQLLLSFPGARPAGRGATAVVLVSYVIALAPGLSRSSGATVALCGALVATAGLRLRRSTGAARQPAGTALAASLLLLVGAGSAVLLRSGDSAGDQAGLVVYQVTMVALAVLLAAGAAWIVAADDEVKRLAVELADGRSSALETALRDALADRSLRVGVWSPDQGAHLDAEGHRLPTAAGAGRRLSPLGAGNEPALVLEHDASTPLPSGVVRSLSEVAALIATNTALSSQLRQRADELALARRRLVDADARERLELERQLASGAGRSLSRLRSTLTLARHQAGADTADELSRAESLLDATRADLGRLSRGLYPAVLAESGLVAALQELRDHAPLAVRLAVDGQVPAALAEITYFVCAEGVANAAKHSGAQSVSISVRCRGALLSIDVADDGVGPQGAGHRTGSGIRGLTDRVAAYGGTLQLTGAAPRGTRLSVRLPLDGPAAHLSAPASVSRSAPSGAP